MNSNEFDKSKIYEQQSGELQVLNFEVPVHK